jgi:GTPase SAR1 family protein
MAEPADTLEGTSLHQLLSNDENSLLDVIDELRSQGIGDLLGEKGLPQIIVCGDQSSGKSSVLEALTRVRFPTKSNVCTTFPTELRLRREPATRISCCIKPAMSRTAEERERLARFQGSFDSPEKFPELITSARECMTGPDSGTGNTFFEDVLEVEIVGPKLAPLTIVDLPGLIHFSKSSSGDQDISFVSSLVERYMRQENSIILAVVSAHNDINNQTVLSRIEKIESGGNRTLGIITKPDELPPGSEKEQEFLDYARNNEMKFRYGWHVVRNRKYEERDHSFEERDATEKEYFRSSRWQALPRRQVGLGVESLREKLSRMLLAHITLSLPSVLVKISADLYQSENELNKLGESRSTPKEQQNYLCDIGDNFREYTKDALEGRYRRKSFFGNPSEHGALEKRLRAYIRKLNDEFANDMLHHGHKWDIVDDTEPGGRISARPKSNLAASRTPEIIGKSDFLNHVDSLAVLERGNELPGTSNPLLVGSLFRQQSEAWGDIAEEHLNRVWSAVKAFMETLLAHMTDERTCNQLLIHVVDPAMEARQQLLGRKLKELLVPYLDHEPIMIDPRFSDKKWSSRTRRIASLIIETMQDDEENGIVTDLSLDEVEAKVIAATTADNHYGSVGALETMEAYYDVNITWHRFYLLC